MTKKAKVCPNEQCGINAHEESQRRENKSIDKYIDQTIIGMLHTYSYLLQHILIKEQ